MVLRAIREEGKLLKHVASLPMGNIETLLNWNMLSGDGYDTQATAPNQKLRLACNPNYPAPTCLAGFLT